MSTEGRDRARTVRTLPWSTTAGLAQLSQGLSGTRRPGASAGGCTPGVPVRFLAPTPSEKQPPTPTFILQASSYRGMPLRTLATESLTGSEHSPPVRATEVAKNIKFHLCKHDTGSRGLGPSPHAKAQRREGAWRRGLRGFELVPAGLTGGIWRRQAPISSNSMTKPAVKSQV